MSKIKEVSAVEYLIEHLKETYHLTEETLYEFQKANKMFEKQIKDAAMSCNYIGGATNIEAQTYYNETYGKKNKQ
jgi:hypothetical protein